MRTQPSFGIGMADYLEVTGKFKWPRFSGPRLCPEDQPLRETKKEGGRIPSVWRDRAAAAGARRSRRFTVTSAARLVISRGLCLDALKRAEAPCAEMCPEDHPQGVTNIESRAKFQPFGASEPLRLGFAHSRGPMVVFG